MYTKKLKVSGALVFKFKKNLDNRGSFQRIFSSKDLKKYKINFISKQESISKNKKKYTLRGMHFNKYYHETKIVTCIKGKVMDVIVDLRKNSKTYLKWDKITLSEKLGNSIYIPPGCAHGFLTLENNTKLYYLINKNYNKKNNTGFIYNDDTINIKWPNKKFTISKNDKRLKKIII